MVKDNRKGRKKTGFRKHQIIIMLMDMSGLSQPITTKGILL